MRDGEMRTRRTRMLDGNHEAMPIDSAREAELCNALIEGERSGALQPFDFAALVRRKRAQYRRSLDCALAPPRPHRGPAHRTARHHAVRRTGLGHGPAPGR